MRVGIVAALGLAACGGAGSSGARATPSSPAAAAALEPQWRRAATAGDALLPWLPPGAELILEIDLARARANPVIGPVLEGALATAGARALASSLGEAVRPVSLVELDAVLLASFAVGTAQAQTLTLVALPADRPAARLAGALGGTAIAERVVAVGPPELVARAAARAGAPVEVAVELLRLRARPMPAPAEGAVVRVAASLSVDARLSLARHAELDPPPAMLGAWLDVADDAALVAWVHPGAGEDARALARLAAAVRGAISELASDLRVAALGLGPPLRGAALTPEGGWLRVAVVVGPARLSRAAQRAARFAPAAPAQPGAGAPLVPPQGDAP